MTTSGLKYDARRSNLDSFTSTQSASTSIPARKKRIRHQFSCWTFQLTFSTDAAALNGGSASGSATLQERQKYLLEHIRSRMANTDRMSHIVAFVEAYYDTSIISSALPEDISRVHFHSVAWISSIHTDGADQTQWMSQTFATCFAYRPNRVQ